MDKHDIHCDPNRIAIQLLKEDGWFKLPLEIPDSLSNKIKQIDLCIGTNGNNDKKVELILNTKNNGTFYYNNNIDDNKYISLIKGSKNNTLEENFIYVKSNELKNCALWAKKLNTKDFNTWKDRLSFDYSTDDNVGLNNTIDLFQEGGNRHIDLRIWFDDFEILTPKYEPVNLDDFLENGKRGWDAVYSNNDKMNNFGIIPATAENEQKLKSTISKLTGEQEPNSWWTRIKEKIKK